jgi:ribosomal protein L11 methyltransferase
VNTEYLCLSIVLPPALHDSAIALLAEIGYDTFEELPDSIKAYIPASDFEENALRETLDIFAATSDFQATYSLEKMQQQNWNAEWEASYESIEVEDFCQIVPSFRQPKAGFTYSIEITPKMSFGTGHHETTRLMIRQMRQMPIAATTVLDMGCGTGILGILALKMGAKSATLIDIDAWSEENSRENAALNGITDRAHILLGDATALPATQFDTILANINRNVLLTDAETYAAHLVPQGWLLLSGFYATDAPQILDCYQPLGFALVATVSENNWVALLLQKN